MEWFTPLTGGLSLGMFVWLFSWGINRVYLTFKMMLS